MNGQINTAVGWTIPLLTKALKEDPVVILRILVLQNYDKLLFCLLFCFCFVEIHFVCYKWSWNSPVVAIPPLCYLHDTFFILWVTFTCAFYSRYLCLRVVGVPPCAWRFSLWPPSQHSILLWCCRLVRRKVVRITSYHVCRPPGVPHLLPPFQSAQGGLNSSRTKVSPLPAATKMAQLIV